MRSVLYELERLRLGKEGVLECDINNPYCVWARDSEHLKAYYFGTKIYSSPGQFVDLSYRYDDVNQHYTHDVCNQKKVIFDDNRAVFLGEDERVEIIFDKEYSLLSCQDNVRMKNFVYLIPTLNGTAFHVWMEKPSFHMRVITSRPYGKLRWNDRYLAWMKGDFAPYVYMSALYGKDMNQHIVPITYSLQKVNDTVFDINWNGHIPLRELYIEMNFHEEKLFQDTTVESRYPNQNNVYGASAFIGHTQQYGVQWLFSKTNFPILDHLQTGTFQRVIWHIPYLNAGKSVSLQLYPTRRRFCSFGTTWENQVPPQERAPITFQSNIQGYLSADVTSIYKDPYSDSLAFFDGCILRLAEIVEQENLLITTGDSCLYPPILEVQMK